MKAAKYSILFAVAVASLWGQQGTDRRTAEIRGNGGGEGKCTLEVRVEDVAEVEIRGREAMISAPSGGAASIVRFQCNQEMPNKPGEFRFKGIDGRGRQNLVRTPGGRRGALIRIEDSKDGAENYTFDIFWRGGSGGNGGGNRGGSDGGWNSGSTGGGGWNNGATGGGWDNGWGSGSGWNNGANFNFRGGREGSGSYRDRSGQRRRLDNATVSITNGGMLSVSFQSDQGNLSFDGPIERRNGRRVSAQVNGSGARGTMEVEMSSNNQVQSISMREIDLTWTN